MLSKLRSKTLKLGYCHCVCMCFIGVSVGSLLGGILYDMFHGAITFRIYGTISLGLFFLHVMVQCVIGRKTHNEQTKGKN
jgi:hypothetical protein